MRKSSITQSKANTEIDVGVMIWGFFEVRASVVWVADWLTGWEPFRLIKTPPWSFHCVPQAVLAYEWYCIVRPLPIPALLNGFNHWFRFSYTVLVESVPLPLLWTPWFPWLTCLEAAVEVSCRPSHGPDLTSTLIANKKWLGMRLNQWLLFNHNELSIDGGTVLW